MKISDVIFQLEQYLKEHGDLRVTTCEAGGYGVRDYTNSHIRVQEIREKRKRESKTYYKYNWEKEPAIEKVLHI